MTLAKNELALLLDKPNSAGPIDTQAILFKMDNEEKFEKAYTELNAINYFEKSKYAFPCMAGSLAFLSLGALGFFIYKSITTPDILKVYTPLNVTEQMIALILKYNGTRIENINSTCGIQIPLRGNISENIFNTDAATICRARRYHNHTLNLISAAYAGVCNLTSPISNYCTWPTNISNTTYSCFNWVMEVLNVPCLPVDTSDIPQPCAGLINNLGCYYNSLDPDFVNHLQQHCGYFANILCNLTDLIFNTIPPDLNTSCANLFVSQEIFKTCDSANEKLANEHIFDGNWTYYYTLQWLWILSCFISVALFIACIVTAVYGTSCLNQKSDMDELPEEDQNEFIESLSYIADANDARKLKEVSIGQAVDSYDEAMLRYEQEKQSIKDRRNAFLSLPIYRNSPVPKLPEEVAKKILFFSGLYTKPPVEDNDNHIQPDIRLAPAPI